MFATERTREIDRVESQTMLAPALERMRPRERQLLWLAYAEGATHREIAEITGLRAAGIRILLFRAKRKLARFLRQRAAAGEKVV
jgi:RNA polymerase sigma-70 factor (ECF subfamily)